MTKRVLTERFLSLTWQILCRNLQRGTSTCTRRQGRQAGTKLYKQDRDEEKTKRKKCVLDVIGEVRMK
jgi:hypothetical protein